jgi:hypothetical protein
MSEASNPIVHREVMEIQATPAQVREFIMTPERILDYYPQPVDGGVLEPGRAIYCRGEMGVSILERIESECSDDCVVVKVTTAAGLEPPYTRERIESAVTFTMVEDWEIAASETGTTLTKTWRDVKAAGDPPFPLEEAVRQGAIHESDALIQGWGRAARQAST